MAGVRTLMTRGEASDFWREWQRRYRDQGYHQWEAGRLAALDLYDGAIALETQLTGYKAALVRVARERDEALGAFGEVPAGLPTGQVDSFLAALPGVRVIVRERNPAYSNGPAARYMDPPTPVFIEHDLTRQEVCDAFRAALREGSGGKG